MRSRGLIVAGIAVVFALIAVVFLNSFFTGLDEQQQRAAAEQKLARIVVASQDLSFGTPIGSQNLRLANWPASSVPAGAFTSVEAAARNERVVIKPIVVGEPVLASKVSGVDGRAVLSANLPVGKVAYSIPVTDVAGVAGFVRPGDRVDVILTRQIPGKGADAATDKMTDVILEGVPVLGVNQVQDERATKPEVAKTATLEVDSLGAQKLALGIQLGTLSLALRNVADQATGARSTVLPRHLSTSTYNIPERSQAQSIAPPQGAMAMRAPMRAMVGATVPARAKGPTMTVYRGAQQMDYEVQRGR